MRQRLVALVSGGAALSVGIGRLTADAPGTALALAAVPLVLAVCFGSAGLIPALAFPATFLSYRVGPHTLDMSVSDLVLVCSIPVSLLAARTTKGRTGALLRIVITYQLVLLVVVNAHPSSIAIGEWVHRLGLMAGSLLVGAAVVRLGSLRFAIRAMLVTAAVFAVVSMVDSVTSGFAAAYPLGANKNAAGSLLAMTIALVASMPVSDVIPPQFYRPLYVLFGAGLAATRSRGAMLGLAFVLCVLVFTRRGARRFRVITAITVAAGLAFVWTSVQNERRSDIAKTGPISTRERQQSQASALFKANRVTGAGIRYYDENGFLALAGRPSSTPYEAAAESGIVGIADLLFLVGGTFLVLRRMDSPYRAAALAMFGVKVFHGVVDIFWVAGPFTLPWLVMGMAAALSTDEAGENDEPMVAAVAGGHGARR